MISTPNTLNVGGFPPFSSGSVVGISHTDSSEFSPLSLFKDGKQGVWYDPSDLSTLFQDAAGTVLVTTNGNPVGKILDKSGNNNHATQTVSAARPLYNTEPSRLLLDKVDDAIVINFPKRIVGSMTIATTTGTATYGVDIPQGNLTLGKVYFPSNNIVGLVINEGELSEKNKSKLVKLLVGKGAIESFASNTSLANAFRNWSFLTSFPLINTSKVTNFQYAWYGNKLTSFPLIDTSSATNFQYAWYANQLTSFPLIDTSRVTNFQNAWSGNQLTSFPLIDTSRVTNFSFAWSSNKLTSFPLIDTSSVTNFSYALHGNSTLTSFPENAFDNVKGGNFSNAFIATNLTQESIDGILVSLVTSGIATGTRVFNQSGGSAPSAIGNAAINTLRSRGWTVTVTGGY